MAESTTPNEKGDEHRKSFWSYQKRKIWNFELFELQDNKEQIKVYTNFENGGFTYGLEEDIVNYIALAEDPFGT